MTWLPSTTAGWTSQPFGSSPGGFNPEGGHTGEDRAVPAGTPLAARGAGVVLQAGQLGGTWADNPWLISPDWAGMTCVIDYGPFLSIYAHLSAVHVRPGDTVSPGQHVADSGNSGSATSGPHVHEEAMPDGWDVMNGTYGRVDPNHYGTRDAGLVYQGAATPAKTEQEVISMSTNNRIVLATNGTSKDVWRCEGGKRRKIDNWREVEVIKDLAVRGVLDVFQGGPEYRMEDLVQSVWYLDALGVAE